MSLTMFDIGNTSPCICGSACLLKWSVEGCLSTGIAGLDVNVWTDATKATFLGLATDNGSGNYSLSVSAAGSYYYEISNVPARFQLTIGTRTFTCNSPQTVHLLPASGYACSTFCNVPLPTTLYLTSTKWGNQTLVWTSSVAVSGAIYNNVWFRNYPYSYPGCSNCGCPPEPLNIYFILNGVLQVTWIYSQVNNAGVYNCPDGYATALDPTMVLGHISLTCPVPPSIGLSASYTYTTHATFDCGTDGPVMLYNATNYTDTFTVTE